MRSGWGSAEVVPQPALFLLVVHSAEVAPQPGLCLQVVPASITYREQPVNRGVGSMLVIPSVVEMWLKPLGAFCPLPSAEADGKGDKIGLLVGQQKYRPYGAGNGLGCLSSTKISPLRGLGCMRR